MYCRVPRLEDLVAQPLNFLSATLNLIPLMSNTQKDTQILKHIERDEAYSYKSKETGIQQDPAWYILPSVMCAQHHHCWMILNQGKL